MVNNHDSLSATFAALAHPDRRAILRRLVHGPTTIGEASRGLAISKPAVTRHVRVLEEAGVLVRSVEGRTHRLTLDTTVLAAARAWLDESRGVWERHLDAMEARLATDASDIDPEHRSTT